jgi:hypothetical protein
MLQRIERGSYNLEDVLKGIRRVEIEPGCSLHIFQEAEAHSAAQFLSEKFNFEVKKALNIDISCITGDKQRIQTSVSSATLPSIVLSNLPAEVTANGLLEAFQSFKPQTINITGSTTANVRNVTIISNHIERQVYFLKAESAISLIAGKRFVMHSYIHMCM